MKKLIILICVLLSSSVQSQWGDLKTNVEIVAFGVHDTSLFLSGDFGQGGSPPFVGGFLARLNPKGYADTGLDFTQGNFTTFASVGRYFFAGSYNAKLGSGAGIGAMTSDNGSSWKTVVLRPVGGNGTYIFGGLGLFPVADTTVVARSRDSGKTWEKLPYPAAMSYIGEGAYMYMNTQRAGIFRSFDSGTTWLPVHSPFIGSIMTMGSLLFTYQPYIESASVSAPPHNGILIVSRDSGMTWDTVHVDSAGTPEFVTQVATDGSHLFAGGHNKLTGYANGIYLSCDTGHTWKQIDEGLGDLFNVLAFGIYDSSLYVSMSNDNVSFPFATYSRPLSDFCKPLGVVYNEFTAPADTIAIYPNPANNLLTIATNEAQPIYSVTVMNLLGEEMMAVPGGHGSTLKLDISKLRSGTYFLRIETQWGASIRKFVRE